MCGPAHGVLLPAESCSPLSRCCRAATVQEAAVPPLYSFPLTCSFFLASVQSGPLTLRHNELRAGSL